MLVKGDSSIMKSGNNKSKIVPHVSRFALTTLECKVWNGERLLFKTSSPADWRRSIHLPIKSKVFKFDLVHICLTNVCLLGLCRHWRHGHRVSSPFSRDSFSPKRANEFGSCRDTNVTRPFFYTPFRRILFLFSYRAQWAFVIYTYCLWVIPHNMITQLFC